MRLSFLQLTAAALVLGSVACSGTVAESEKTASVSAAIQGGASDTNATDNYAVGVANRYGGICSGTLIAPNLVLTARHCVIPPDGNVAVSCGDEFPKNVAPSYLYVTTEANLYRAKNYYEAAEIITPTDASFCGNDIALVMLQKSIPADQAKPVTPVVQFSMTDASRVSNHIAAIGFGVTNPSTDDSGQRRIRENIEITCVDGDSRYSCATNSMLGQILAKAEFITEGFVCSGDSGSGAFDQSTFTAGQPLVLGTLSRGPQTQDKCLSAIYTRTDAHADMIIAAGVRAAEKGAYVAAAWATPKASDASRTSEVGETQCEGDICTSTDATESASGSNASKTTTSTGCSTSPGRTTSGGFAALFVGLAIVAARRLRRSHTRS